MAYVSGEGMAMHGSVVVGCVRQLVAHISSWHNRKLRTGSKEELCSIEDSPSSNTHTSMSIFFNNLPK